MSSKAAKVARLSIRVSCQRSDAAFLAAAGPEEDRPGQDQLVRLRLAADEGDQAVMPAASWRPRRVRVRRRGRGSRCRVRARSSWPRPFKGSGARAAWISGSMGRPLGVSHDQAMPGLRVISSTAGRSLGGAGRARRVRDSRWRPAWRRCRGRAGPVDDIAKRVVEAIRQVRIAVAGDLQPHQAAAGRRNADRAQTVGGVGHRHDAGSHGRGRPARRAAGVMWLGFQDFCGMVPARRSPSRAGDAVFRC